MALVRSIRPSATLHLIDPRASLAHVQLTRYGPFDLIVDDLPFGGGGRFLASFYQLSAGGAMVIRLIHPRTGLLAPGKSVSRLLRIAATPHATLKNPLRPPLRRTDLTALAEAVESVTTDGSYLAVVRSSTRPVLAKFRESEMNQYLSLIPNGPDRLLDVMPAEPFTSRCVFREFGDLERPDFFATYETIDISLRDYHDVLASPVQLVSKDRFLAPESFRHNQRSRLNHRAINDVAPRFARLLYTPEDPVELRGTYFYLDNEVRGHYGHLMTEQMSKFWAWSRVKAIDPEAKALVAINKLRELRPWELAIYAAGGIAPEDIVMIREPVRVERLIAGTPLMSNPDYVHPAILETWREVGDNLLASDSTDIELPQRFFCARRIKKRACHNAAEVEQLFAAQGFAIIYPEDYSLGDQVRFFRGATVMAGWIGSGMFSMCFAEDPKRVILIGSTAYSARNEYLFAALLGHQIDSITCIPDGPHFQSPFSFDHDREGRYLQEVFDSLPRGDARPTG